MKVEASDRNRGKAGLWNFSSADLIRDTNTKDRDRAKRGVVEAREKEGDKTDVESRKVAAGGHWKTICSVTIQLPTAWEFG